MFLRASPRKISLGADARLRLFRSRWLESLSIINLPGFLLVWSIVLPLPWLAARDTASPFVAGLLVASGLLCWSLAEYALHRFVFHWRPGWGPWARLVFLVHGNHHVAPGDPLRNMMPPIVSLPLAALIWAACIAVLGPAGSWVMAGFLAGYVGYDLVHYGCHQWPMKGRLVQALKRHHMRHHHARQLGNFAVTGVIWDRLLGTRIGALKGRPQ